MHEVLYGIAAALCGIGVSYINYRLTKKLLDSGGSAALKLSFRAVITALFIVLLFLAGSRLSLPMEALLAGGAAGLTLGVGFFSVKLLRGAGARKGGGRPEGGGTGTGR